MKKHLLLALAAIVLCYVACNKEADEPTPTPSEPVVVTGVSLNKTMVVLEIGESVTVEATVTPETAVNKEVKWSIANTAIATVSNGVVTGVAEGETELTVTTDDGGHTATIPVKVVTGKVAVTGVSLNMTMVALEIGESVTVEATVTPETADNKEVTWSIANTAIATVTDGVVTAVAEGETELTVTTDDGGHTATIPVVVTEKVVVTGVSLNKTMVALEIGESVTVEATVTPENATNKAVEWSIANTAIATVSNGVVTGVAEGETELTVTTDDGGHTATIPVKVVTEKIPVTGIEWAACPPIGFQCKVGYTRDYAVAILPNNATDMGVTFTSSNPEVATVKHHNTSNNFVSVTFTAVGEGSVTITATTNDGGFTATTETITVIQAVLVESIEFSKDSYAMNVGDVLALMPTILPENADNKKLEWSTSDASIISVDKQGMVEALAIGNATVTALATDGSGVSATVAIAVSNPATEVNFSGSDSKAKYTTWHGNKFELDVRTTPANVDLRTLNWSFLTLNDKANPLGVSYEVTADKATVCCVVDENSTRNYCKVVVSTADNSDYANAQVDFLTYPWIMASKNNGDTFEYEVRVLCGTSNWKFNYEAENYSSTQLYFVAYCPSDEKHQAEASPLDYYPNDIIPTSAYTLTSSDPEKLSLEKVEGKGYKLNFLADDMAAVDLTYTCGDFVQTYRINIIP